MARGKIRRAAPAQVMKAAPRKIAVLPASPAARGIFAADGLADANGGGGRNSQRDHVGERDGVERDLMAGERHGAEARDQGGDHGEDSALERELNGGRIAEGDEAANAREINVDGSFEQIGAMAAVVPQEIDDQDGGHVQARDGGGPAGADGAHGGRSPVSVNKNPVADGVDDVGGDEREGHDADHVHGLEAAADGEIEEQGEESHGESLGVGNGERENCRDRCACCAEAEARARRVRRGWV